MNFDNPAWRDTPVRTGFRVAKSLARKRIERLSRVAVPYDGGRTSIYADLHTPLGLELYRYGHRDPDLDLVGRLLARGDVFVDGGANVGLFTLVAAERVGTTGKVLAFEPGRTVRMALLANVVLNGFKQVEVVPFALAAEPGEARFRVYDAAGAGLNHLEGAGTQETDGGDVEIVTVTTLDAVLAPGDRARLSLMKLDLEGAEHAALRGADATLRAAHPDIVIEIAGSHLARMGSSPGAVAELLASYGYRFYRTETDAAGALVLAPAPNLDVPADRPNVFATVDPARVRSRGINLRD
jgi:FkbM family methyltransferase